MDAGEIRLLGLGDLGDRNRELASVGRPGRSSRGLGAGGEPLDDAAAGGHHAEFAAERAPAVALHRAVGGERDPTAVGRDDGVRVVVGTAGELSGGAAARVDDEDVVPGADAVAERVAAVVDLVQHGGARRAVVLDETLRVDIDDRDQAAAVGQPYAGLHLIWQVGQPLGLAAGHRQEPELARRVGVGRA